MWKLLFIAGSLFLVSACATSGKKIPGIREEGHWKTQLARKNFPDLEPRVQVRGSEIVKVRHLLRHEIRRKYHLHPKEHRWVLVVTLVAKDSVQAKELAKAEVIAVKANGQKLALTQRGYGDHERRFEAPHNDGERAGRQPVAYIVDGKKIDVAPNP